MFSFIFQSTLPFLRMAKQQNTVAAAPAVTPVVRQVQKPVQSVAVVSKSQPTILPSTQLNRQVDKIWYLIIRQKKTTPFWLNR
jgi:hypothetical protein